MVLWYPGTRRWDELDGKIFISPVTYSGFNLSDAEKNEISLYLSDKSVLGITPILIDPDYLYIDLTSEVSVNFKNTSSSSSVINSKIINSIS